MRENVVFEFVEGLSYVLIGHLCQSAYTRLQRHPPSQITSLLVLGGRTNKKASSGEYEIWKSKELVRNLLSRDPQTGLLEMFGWIRFFRHLSRRLFKLPALPSSREHGLHGILIRSVKPSSSLPARAGFSTKADMSRRFVLEMWCCPRLARSIGMGLRRPQV